jgi:Oxygenase domain of the 2OGFeDO superfamily
MTTAVDTDLPIVKVKRLIDKKVVREMRGELVPDIEPNITTAGIYVDEETGEPFMVYMPMPSDMVPELRAAVRDVKYSSSGVTRQSTGTENHSRTFGMAPRKPFQTREACRPTSLSYDQPDVHKVLERTADRLSQIMRKIAPDVYDADVQETSEVDKEWRISEDSLWTSGVINKTSTLPYHYDGNNFDMWSAMPVIRRGTRGGALSVPEYGVTIECRDGWVLFFPGFRLLHGVTPIAHVAKDAYRYTVVYYCLRGMKDCFTYAVEQAEARKRRTEREVGLASAVKGDTEFKVGKR